MTTKPTEPMNDTSKTELDAQVRAILKAPMRSEVSTADIAVGMWSSTMLSEKIHDLAVLIAQREQAAELRGRDDEISRVIAIWGQLVSQDIREDLEERRSSLRKIATRPLDNSERNAHYNVYKLGKEYREATKPEKGTH